jgi:cyclopropane-fatty-acyl-phospholipid synthase
MNDLTRDNGDTLAIGAVAERQVTPSSSADAVRATALLQRIFRQYRGRIAIRLWNGASLSVGRGAAGPGTPPYTLVFRSAAAVRSLLLGRDQLRLAEAYISGDIDVEGDFITAIRLKDELGELVVPPGEGLQILLSALRLGTWRRSQRGDLEPAQAEAGGAPARHSRHEDHRAIQFHYDVSNKFYALWLDSAMVYSCAYFERQDGSLEDAQRDKLDHICRKLELRAGERLLDVGCGWGALVIHAATHYGVTAHGITLSSQQLGEAQRRIDAAGLGGRVTVELRDYRELAGEAIYDKVSSIGMFEHVGLENLPAYYAVVHRLLKPAGLFLNHGITHEAEGWVKSPGTEFINRYVFPGGQLDSIGNIQRGMERAHFEIVDVEALRRHYALTLRHWVARLDQARARALDYVSESRYRIWRLYMAASALDFESGELGIYQVLASRRGKGTHAQALSRRHLYPMRHRQLPLVEFHALS